MPIEFPEITQAEFAAGKENGFFPLVVNYTDTVVTYVDTEDDENDETKVDSVGTALVIFVNAIPRIGEDIDLEDGKFKVVKVIHTAGTMSSNPSIKYFMPSLILRRDR